MASGRRYIDILTIIINFPYSTCISSFLGQQHPYFFVNFFNVFSVFYIYSTLYIIIIQCTSGLA